MFPSADGTGLFADQPCEGGRAALFVDDLSNGNRHTVTLPLVTYTAQAKITLGNVTGGNVGIMEIDAGWQELDEPWKRLRWARVRWQRSAGAVNASAKDAAVSLGMEPGTYRAYERPADKSKHIALDHQMAIQFGRRFRVSWVWLLTGEGTPFEVELSENQDRAVKAMSQLSEEEQKTLADLAEQWARRRAS